VNFNCGGVVPIALKGATTAISFDLRSRASLA